MKPRDLLNTVENYTLMIEAYSSFIAESYEEIHSLKDEEKTQSNPLENFDIIKNIYDSIPLNQMRVMLATYSAGYPLEEFKEEYLKFVDSLTPVWRKQWGYVQMLWALSIGLLLDIDSETFDKLVELVKKDDPEDYLMDTLIRQRRPDWPLREEFMFGRPYSFTRKIMEEEDPDKALAFLKEYLTKKWYSGQRDTGWYDLHKRNAKNHFGYWSFESGALCQIKGLDYTQLEGLPYFPYDLVAEGSEA